MEQNPDIAKCMDIPMFYINNEKMSVNQIKTMIANAAKEDTKKHDGECPREKQNLLAASWIFGGSVICYLRKMFCINGIIRVKIGITKNVALTTTKESNLICLTLVDSMYVVMDVNTMVVIGEDG
jgi:hypothetical protein